MENVCMCCVCFISGIENTQANIKYIQLKHILTDSTGEREMCKFSFYCQIKYVISSKWEKKAAEKYLFLCYYLIDLPIKFEQSFRYQKM